jgi:hypothetical protein
MGRGALVFKGETTKKKKKKTKSVKSHRPTKPEKFPSPTNARTVAPTAATVSAAAEPPAPPQLIPGTGTVVVSGTVVTGGPFPTDLHVGDAILIQDELRVVTLKVSDQCLNLSSALTGTTSTRGAGNNVPYSYIRKPTVTGSNAAQDAATVPVATMSSQLYRERTESGNYRLKPVPADVVGTGDRSEALAWRSKKTSDKYC